MAAIRLPLLVISGPVGVGKTTVGNELSTSLERRRVAHTFIDLDTLAETYPRPPGDRFGNRLALLNLRDVWINCAAAGSRNLIVARVVETRDALVGTDVAEWFARIAGAIVIDQTLDALVVGFVAYR